MTLGDTQRQLEQVIADLRQIGEITVSTVWPIAKKVVGAVRKIISVATDPPPPDPATVREVAARWREMAPAMGEWHANDVRQAQNTIPETVWGRTPGDPYGETTGDKARTSIANFKTRSTTIGPAATGVGNSLDTFGGSMEKARDRWHNAFTSLKDDVDWNNIPKAPWDAIPYVRKLVGDVIHGVEELAGAYGDADKAVNTAKGELGKALEGITLPDHTSVAAGAIGSVNNWSDVKDDPDGHKDGTGLRPGVQERADANLAAMSPEDRTKAQAMLDGAKDEARRNWIISALARGGDVATLQRFSDKLALMDDQQVRELDPVEYAKNHPDVLTQPDGTTCGSSSLVVAKMINDPVYAMKMLTGYDAAGSATPQPGQSITTSEVTSKFADEAKKMHDSTNNALVPGWGTTWPETFGTPPGGAADEMGKPGGPGVPGSAYQFEVANPLGPSGDYQAISAAVQSGQSVPLFVGSGVNGHIVLVTGMQGDSLEIYEPSSGQKMTIPRDDFVNNRISFGGETRYRPWGEVVPEVKGLRLSPVLLLIFVLAASCPKHPEIFEPNDVDATRSARLATDAWLAPAEAHHGSYNGLNNISRESVVRTASFAPGDPLEVVTRETRKALRNGWFLTYAHCGKVTHPMSSSGVEPTLSGVEVNLEKSPTDPDAAAIAQLTAYRVDPDPRGQEIVKMEINAFARYHSDKGWPNLLSIPIDTTCLVMPGASTTGIKTSAAFPSGIVQGVMGGQPLNEKGEPDKTAQ